MEKRAQTTEAIRPEEQMQNSQPDPTENPPATLPAAAAVSEEMQSFPDTAVDHTLFRAPGVFETVSGTVKFIIFKSPTNNYRIATLAVDEQPDQDGTKKGKRRTKDKEVISFLGNDLGSIYEGMEVVLHGVWGEHPRYGLQLRVSHYEPKEADPKHTLIDFFSSERFPGIGHAAATQIVQALGENAIEEIRKDPKVLYTKCRLHVSQAQSIHEGLKTIGEKATLALSLIEWKVPNRELSLLMQSPDIDLFKLREDCFQPYFSDPDFSYEACVRIANGFHLSGDDPRRLEAATYKQLRELLFRMGSTWVHTSELLAGGQQAQLQQSLARLRDRGKIVIEDDRVYLLSHWLNEICSATSLYERAGYFKQNGLRQPQAAAINSLLSDFEKKENVRYDSTQRQAIHTFFQNPIMILTGGPGTGKTTVVKGILYLLSRLFPYERVDLAAPTGRAAKRLSELSGNASFTLHSLLGWDGGHAFKFNEANQMHPAWLIVDEFSMVDNSLFAALMKALTISCRLLIIGDEEQLESVGEGSVLADLIRSKQIPVAKLTRLYRQQEGSAIAALADAIRQEQPLHFEDPVEMIEPDANLTEQIRQLVAAQPSPAAIQLLAPKYEGPGGILELNAMMQEMLNPFSPDKTQITASITVNSGNSHPVIFRVGDRVMLKVNMAERDVYNGDIGEIVDIDPGRKAVTVLFDETEVEISGDLNFAIIHGWAVTIHKAQGSEYRQLILSLPRNAARMFSRRLIYTAVSRAKKKLWIFCNPTLFANAARRKDGTQRQTSLCGRIEQAWKGTLPSGYQAIAQAETRRLKEELKAKEEKIFGSQQDDAESMFVSNDDEEDADGFLYL